MSRLPKPEVADLISYVIGETTPEEAAHVQQWLVESHDHQQLFNNVQRFVQAVRTRRALSQTDSADVIARAFAAHVTEDKRKRDTATTPSTQRANSVEKDLMMRGSKLAKRAGGLPEGSLGRRTLRRWVWIGSATALAVGVSFLVRLRSETRTSVTRVYATAAQQQAVIDLTDGTRVTLSPSTTLRLRDFGAGSRTVVLDGGEAYFEVAHTSGVPFMVRSGTATARALGTAFLVRRAAGDSHVRVSVTDGKVQLLTPGRNTSGVTLTARQVGDVTDSTIQMRTADDLAPGTEWESGDVIFRNISLATVLQTLSQWYGYQFRYVDQSLGARKVTMLISTRSSSEALATIERVLAVNLTIAGDTVTLVPHPPQSIRRTPRIRIYDVWTPTREVGR